MRTLIAWILILHTLHLPVPFPDLDGECRGAPILSLLDRDAWHLLILGVRPNDDIDRGPIRNADDDTNPIPTDSPYGDSAVLANAVHSYETALLPVDSWFAVLCSHSQDDDFVRLLSLRRRHPPPQPIARTACICFCSWLV